MSGAGRGGGVFCPVTIKVPHACATKTCVTSIIYHDRIALAQATSSLILTFR